MFWFDFTQLSENSDSDLALNQLLCFNVLEKEKLYMNIFLSLHIQYILSWSSFLLQLPDDMFFLFYFKSAIS